MALYIKENITIGDSEKDEEPQVRILEFTIDGNTYYFEEGMNWGDWVYSEYNTVGWRIGPSSYVMDPALSKSVKDSKGELAFYSMEIVENEKYTSS